jgi:hypothetical protein
VSKYLKSVALFLTSLILFSSSASALSSSQADVFNLGIHYFNTEIGSPVGLCGTNGIDVSGSGSGGGTGQLNAAQVQIAKIVMGIAKTDNIGKQGALIGLMVALDESHLQIYSNSNVPISLSNPSATIVGSDHNSVGVFQQQPDQGWSTFATGSAALASKDAVWQDMDPAFSTEAFFGTPSGATLPSGLVNSSALTHGLQNLSGWQSMQPWDAAQAVQGSGTASGLNYKTFVAPAQDLIDQYWDLADAVPLPIPINGGTASAGGQLGNCTSSNSSISGACNVSAPVYGSVNGSGNEYSQQQLTTIFGDPGTLNDHSSMQDKQVSVNFLGHSVSVNPLVAPCLQAVANELQQSGSTYQINDMACYRFDSDNGSSNIGLKSYHSYGAACDINASANPFSADGSPLPHDIPQEYVSAFNHHGFTWGGNWVSVKDYMHFEFNGITPQ